MFYKLKYNIIDIVNQLLFICKNLIQNFQVFITFFSNITKITDFI